MRQVVLMRQARREPKGRSGLDLGRADEPRGSAPDRAGDGRIRRAQSH